LGLEAVLQSIGSMRSVCFGLRRGLKNNWPYMVRVLTV